MVIGRRKPETPCVVRSIAMGTASLVLAFAARASEDIESVLAHPPFAAYYACAEHRQGELPYLGDDLGSDCVVQKLVTEDGRTWARAHEGDEPGTSNGSDGGRSCFHPATAKSAPLTSIRSSTSRARWASRRRR